MGVVQIMKCVPSYSKRSYKAVLAINMAAKGVIECTLYICNKTEHYSFKKWVCHADGEALNRRLAHIVSVLIMA